MSSRPWAVAAVIAATLFAANGAVAGTLEDLERARAYLVYTLLAKDIAPAERESRVRSATYRLVDLERRVLRDQRLIGAAGPVVRIAFERYDLTFLVHAAAEKGVAPVELWLGEMGLSSAALAQAKPRKR